MNLTGMELLNRVMTDSRYTSRLLHGSPRSGHEEGTIVAHIEQLERNITRLHEITKPSEYWNLRVLTHVHDIMKAAAAPGVLIKDPGSHASLARMFLAEFTEDKDLLNIVQHHDVGWALYKQWERDGKYSFARFRNLLDTISDWDLFLFFTIVDGYTPSKNTQQIRWFVERVEGCMAVPRVLAALEVFGI